MATAEASTTTARSVPFASIEQDLVGRLGPWQLVRQIGEGSLTRVYLARPVNAAEQSAAYAVKVLRQQWWRDPQAIAGRRREAWIGSRVSHPNVVPVLSAAVEQPPFYTVMPRLTGATLRQVLADGRRPALPVTLWIVRQIAEGLEAVFQCTGMIHADVKPSNVFLAPTGHATLLDFGYAHTPHESATWVDRPLIGTLNYIAPETVTSALAADIRSDIYSLGVVLYEMLTGRLPLTSDDPGELAVMHRERKPPCIRELRSDLPKPVASLVHTMLAKEPIRRPSSHKELVDRLTRLEIECFAMR
jgi:serine/threonine-protein kinase